MGAGPGHELAKKQAVCRQFLAMEETNMSDREGATTSSRKQFSNNQYIQLFKLLSALADIFQLCGIFYVSIKGSSLDFVPDNLLLI